MVIFLFFAINAWCANVIVAPEDNSRQVFKRGIWKGENTSIACGGQTHPNTCVGANAEWKKAQKKAKKNRTSDTINSTIPNLRLFCTKGVWWKLNVPSLITSLHQKDNIVINSIIPNCNRDAPLMKKWNILAVPRVM